jgi:hypothetical protein
VLSQYSPLSLRESGAAPTSGIRPLGVQLKPPIFRRSTDQRHQPSARCSATSRLAPYEQAQHRPAASARSVLSNYPLLSLREWRSTDQRHTAPVGIRPDVGRSTDLHQDRASLSTSRRSAEQWRSTDQRHPPPRCSARSRLAPYEHAQHRQRHPPSLGAQHVFASLAPSLAQHRPAASALSVSSMKPPISRRSTDLWQTAPLCVQAGSRAQYRPPSISRLAPYEQAQRRPAAQHRPAASAPSVLSKIAPHSVRAGAAQTEASAFSQCSASIRPYRSEFGATPTSGIRLSSVLSNYSLLVSLSS